MSKASTVEAERTKYQLLQPLMTERLRRQWAACEAESLGRGGVRLVAEATGLSRTTIWAGRRELRQQAHRPQDDLAPERVRAPGGGRHRVERDDPALLTALRDLVESSTRGDPQSPLCWTSKSTRRLAAELRGPGHAVSHQTVAALLDDLGYSLQANRKTKEGRDHPDRDAQFAYINQQVRAFQEEGQPAVSVDARKKELIGDFRNSGREWHHRGQPEEVRAKDFLDKQLGKVIPEGVYDLGRNEGWVSVGVDHDTAEFAAASIRRWWQEMGSPVYPRARRLLITADAGGSNGHRSWLWKVVVQGLANDLGLRISVCHFPPGTSQWNKIEHRMFCYITKNWRGKPLSSRAIVVNLIGHTTTEAGLRIQAELDTQTYRTGIKVSDQELAAVRLEKATFHGEWNYTIAPRE
ncbi:MAG: ISAzo13 family transposase [Isosphaeraceae bacterium]